MKVWRWTSATMVFVESDTECLSEIQLREKVNSHKKFEGKLKRFKNWPSFCQTRIFRDWGESPTSRQGKPPKHSKTKLWKNFLSVFHDWKVYLWRSRELSCENLCVPFTTRPLSLANKSPKLTRELAAKACDLDDPQLSQQNRATLFLKFFSFCKNKILSKNTLNTQKSFCVWINKDWACETHFNKYSHINEYGIHWT